VTVDTGQLSGEAPIDRRPASMVELPLMPLQEGWLTAETRYPDATTPLILLVHRLRGPLETDALVRAVGAVVDRHENLRARFVHRDGTPAQVIEPPNGLAVERIDLTDLPEEAREERARELLLERRAVRFDLERGPLAAACLLRLADDDHVLTVTVHHILADGASLTILDRELAAYYRAFVDGTVPDLPELPVQYGDFAVWYATTPQPQQAEDLEFWVDQLAGLPILQLRTDRPRPARKGAPAGDVRHLISGDLAKRAVELGRTRRSSLFMVLLAAFQVVLARRSGQADICVGVPVAGTWRTRPELAPLIGLFNTMLPVRRDLSGDPTFAGHLTGTRDALLDALDHQEVALSRLTAALGIPHDPGQTLPCPVLFDFDEHFADSELDLPGVRVEGLLLGLPKIPYDLFAYAWLGPDGLWTRFIYDTALFTHETMTDLAAEYEQILLAAVGAPESRISELA
jgi:hypothetical protein